jgi:pyruvate,water dikinase
MGKYTFAFDSTETPEHDLLGGKCTSLAIMTGAGMPVPPGFAVTTDACDAVMTQTTLRDHSVKHLAGLDPNAGVDVTLVQHIRELIMTQSSRGCARRASLPTTLMELCGGEGQLQCAQCNR